MTKTMIRLAALAAFIFVNIFIPRMAWATCTVSNPYSGTTVLRGSYISAGDDMPVGTAIFRQLVPGYANVNYTCTGSNPVLTVSVPGGTLAPGSADTFLSGIAGVGIKFYAGTNESAAVLTPTSSYTMALPAASGTLSTATLSFFLTAYKIGPITPGQAGAVYFPPIKMDLTDSDSSTPVRAAYTNFISGGFVVNKPSCTTPDFTFNLGNSFPPATNNNSGWVSTPVTLTSCSAFNGNSSDFQSYQIVKQGSSYYGSISQSGTFAKNTVTMTLNPQIPPFDASTGLLANQTGSGYATGVAVQIATQSGSTYTPINLDNNIVFNPALGTSNVSFPLAARMVRTSNTVTAGAVSTSITYTITYQ
ncbi:MULTISPECIES: fimbrial protein [unclassified Cedecea]|uniref:fimbrial protein n=1 Tax=unclassified Cedecea TaxID=2649846 RepID=UPI0030197C39